MNETNTESGLQIEQLPAQTNTQVSSFANSSTFEHIQRVAKVFSTSELVPKKYQGNIANCVIALEMATRMNVSPLMVMQNLDIILGRPCWSSTFLIASLNACGKFSPIRYEEDNEEGGRTRAMAIDKKTGDKLYGVWVTMEMAKAEGWVEKNGSKWKTMPALMRRYRAASFFTKQFAPEISMGFQTTDEVIDIEPMEETPIKVDKEKERIELMISDAQTIEDLDAIYEHVPETLMEKFLEKKGEISGVTNGNGELQLAATEGKPEPRKKIKP